MAEAGDCPGPPSLPDPGVVDAEVECMNAAGTQPPSPHAPRAIHGWAEPWAVPTEGNPAVRHISVDFVERAMPAVLTIL